MAELTTTFKLVDDMSDKLSNIAAAGQETLLKFENLENAVDDFFNLMIGASESAAVAVTEISSSFKEYENGIQSAANATESYNESVITAANLFGEFADTEAKTAETMQEQEEVLSACEMAAAGLRDEIETGINVQSELSAVMENAIEIIKETIENDEIFAEMKRELAAASELASQSIQELESAQAAAEEALKNYNDVVSSGTKDLEKLNEAAQAAVKAAENLSKANEKAKQTVEDLGKASKEAAEECEKTGKKCGNAFESMASALVAAGITSLIKDVVSSAYELADAFSEAESTIVKATGASGEALDDLNQSMMAVFSEAKSGSSLDDVSGAIGEINTRMGLTGDKLTEVAGQFLDFSNITGTNVVGSVQNVTKIMNKWGVEGENVENVLDRLSYAGQVSGISVDALSNNLISGAAIFQEAGLALDNAVSMLADFELAGINGSTAITAMRTAVKNFTGEGLNAAEALPAVIEEIANMGNDAEATALAVETFGSRAGIDMANAIKNGTITVESFTGSLEEANGTLDKTAENSQTLGQKWQQTSNKIKAAFTSALQPTIDKMASGFTDIMDSMGDFLNAHPGVAKAIAALGVGLGVIVAGISGVAFATKVAIPAIISLGTAFNTALGPIGWVALVITGVTTAVSFLSDAFDDAGDELAGMTETTKEQYYELQRVNTEYERACEIYGKESAQAGELALQVSRLEEEYERTKQTVEEFTAEIEENKEAIESIHQTYTEAITSADDLYDNSIFLTSQLFALSNQSDKTGTTLDTMSGIVNKLNSSYEDLGLTIDMTTGKLNYSIPDLYEYISKVKEKQKQETAMEGLMSAMERYSGISDANQQATREYEEALQKYQKLKDDYNDFYKGIQGYRGSGAQQKQNEISAAKVKMDELSETAKMAQANYDLLTSNIRIYCEQLGYTNEETDEFISQMENSADTVKNLSEQTEDYEKTAEVAYESTKNKVIELCSIYSEVYEAALKSFEGQFGLFDEAKADMDASVTNAQNALDSQLAYWTKYHDNIETIKNKSAEDLGVAQETYDSLMMYVQSGNEQAAGLAASMAKAINEGNTEAVAKLAQTFQKVEEEQKKTAEVTAEWQTNFTDQMNQYKEDMLKIVNEDLNLSDEAKASAEATVNAYVKAINDGKREVVAAANGIAAAVSQAFATAKATVNVRPTFGPMLDGETFNIAGFIKGNAKGTTNAEDIFIAGEEGPELIVGAGGSTVFPADHTERILSALRDINFEEKPLYVEAPGSVTGISESKNYNYNETKSEKKISIEINGNGFVNSRNSFDEETTVNFLYDNIRPVLMNILRTEIYEEGSASYGY